MTHRYSHTSTTLRGIGVVAIALACLIFTSTAAYAQTGYDPMVDDNNVPMNSGDGGSGNLGPTGGDANQGATQNGSDDTARLGGTSTNSMGADDEGSSAPLIALGAVVALALVLGAIGLSRRGTPQPRAQG